MVEPLFFPNRPVPPNRFVGRTSDIQIAFDKISSQNPDYRHHLALWGGPGVGKSSFLKYLAAPEVWESHGEDPSKAIIVYLDCEDIRPFMPSNFWRQLLNLLKKNLESNTTLQPEVNLLLEKAKVNHNDLKQILQKIGVQNQLLVLLLDNYDAALRCHEHYTETDLEYFLLDCRHLAISEQSKYLSMIVTSLRSLNEIGPKLTPDNSPWYNHYYFHLIEPFTDDEVDELLGSIPITPALKEGIREIADGNPTLLQNALYRLYSRLRLGEIPEPKTFAYDLLKANKHFCQTIWERSNEEEQTLLMLIALSGLKGHLPNQNFDLGDIENILTQQKNTLINLEERGVIIDNKVKDNRKIYSFASSLMEWWVIQQVFNSNNEELQQRKKVFFNIMSKKQVNKLTGSIRWLWQHREVPISVMEYVGKFTVAVAKPTIQEVIQSLTDWSNKEK
ncbi:MAG: ATP-binding protein [Symploca sp. SIO2E6]|nr:ATP-binding protein [Symploca sp. SIO2E6]